MRGQQLRQGVRDVEIQNQVPSSGVAGTAHRSTRTLAAKDAYSIIHTLVIGADAGCGDRFPGFLPVRAVVGNPTDFGCSAQRRRGPAR